MIEDAGWEPRTARSGPEALDVLSGGECQMVLTDWEMPGMSGIELCRTLRASDRAPYVYCILVTSHSGPRAIVEGLSAGADDFVVKPFAPEELRARIQTGIRALSLDTTQLMLVTLAKLAESRDPETGAHVERVRRYARLLAYELREMGHLASEIDGNYLRLLYDTAPLHDIGKVGIPDSVLLKPGKLTPEEFAVMKTHASLGAQILDAAYQQHPSPYLAMGRDIAAAHHEWFDGSGYPSGLAASYIPLSARIVAVADVYDALTSARVYKPAMTQNQAIQVLAQKRGTHFDPVILDAFLRICPRFEEILRECQDPSGDQVSRSSLN